VILTSLARSELDLKLCRDSIVGEVSVREGIPERLRFVIGDFDTERNVDLVALSITSKGQEANRRPRLIGARGPAPSLALGTNRCAIAWLADPEGIKTREESGRPALAAVWNGTPRRIAELPGSSADRGGLRLA
jgi:hypothetical protein